VTASPGDWIIKGVKGEFYPCKPDIFELTYEIELGKLVITESPDLKWFPSGAAAPAVAIPYQSDSLWLGIEKRLWWLKAWLPWTER
jgi:hypothetical protein